MKRSEPDAAMPPAIDPAVADEIERRLRAIEAADDVRILLAVESGSRAWGFASPDSDYDVRFIYVRRRDWYLKLARGRDVIESPLTFPYDINGWDITKALGLLLKSNAVALEWLQSPIVYRADAAAVAALTSFARDVLQPAALQHHYLSLARRQWGAWIDGKQEVARKKYLYALRPALMLMHIRLQQGMPPMALDALVAALALDTGVVAEIDAFVAAKQRTREMGSGPRVQAFDALIEAEIARAEASGGATLGPQADQVDFADALLLQLIAGAA